MPSISPASAARRNVFGVTPSNFAAPPKLSHGSNPSIWGRKTGILRYDLSAVTRSRVQRLPFAGRQSIAIENTGNHVVIGNQDELPHSFDDVVRCRVSLPSAPFRQA